MSRRSTILALAVSVLVLASFAVAQNPPASDPQALLYAAQSIAALTGGATIGDVTLSGNVTSTAGSNTDTGTITLLAKGMTESRVDLQLTGGNRSDILNGSSGSPQGSWIVNNGVPTSYAAHNCWTDASWFFPALSSLSAASSNPDLVLSYIGADTLNGRSVLHIESYLWVGGEVLFQQISTMDFYLDSTSLLPVAIKFNIHPDNDASVNIPVEVDFSNYQSLNGIQVPFSIKRLVQGNLVLDIAIGSTVLNSGLPDSEFTIQ